MTSPVFPSNEQEEPKSTTETASPATPSQTLEDVIIELAAMKTLVNSLSEQVSTLQDEVLNNRAYILENKTHLAINKELIKSNRDVIEANKEKVEHNGLLSLVNADRVAEIESSLEELASGGEKDL
ncbi:hypothetical protein ScalyP_jg1373 [Parmales sp. scaly parma]|nr:hypothetical protein ScalyP_jg1373 [Parmales sp. scaly parma]